MTLLKTSVKPTYSKEEEQYLNDKINKFSLSATALNDYIESPILFKERYLIKIPSLKNKNMVLGTAIHASMEVLNNSLKNSKKVNFNNLENVFKKSLKKEFEGYDEYSETSREGLNILKKYYNYYIKNNSYIRPVESEYKFSKNIIFKTSFGKEVRLSGKIDKVEIINKDYNHVRIVDYKTSSPKSENQIKGKTKDSDGKYWRQLVFYKLLADMDPNFKSKFSQTKYICKEVEIDFLKSRNNRFVKKSFEVSQKDTNNLTHLINEVMKNIYELNFPEKPIIL